MCPKRAKREAFAKAVPERMVWGSDWPDRGEKHMPDHARLFDLLAEWAPDAAIRERILVDNPSRLYGFSWLPTSVRFADGRSARKKLAFLLQWLHRVALPTSAFAESSHRPS
jgi:hypothetical protein